MTDVITIFHNVHSFVSSLLIIKFIVLAWPSINPPQHTHTDHILICSTYI